MKWLILGALLGLLLAVPQALALATATASVLASQPLLMTFALGAAARPHLPIVGRRTR